MGKSRKRLNTQAKKAKKPKKPKFNRQTFLKYVFINLAIFTFAVLIYFLITKLLFSMPHIFLPLQLIETKTIYFFQHLLGFDVSVEGVTLIYPNFHFAVDIECLEIKQALLFLVLVFSFAQVSMRKRLLGLVFIPVFFAENIARMFLLYPFFLYFGESTAWAIHDFLYLYGHIFFIILLFFLWYFIFARTGFSGKRQKG